MISVSSANPGQQFETYVNDLVKKARYQSRSEVLREDVRLVEERAELDRIGDPIAEDSPRRAASFVDELLVRCRRLADMPRAFPLAPPYEHSDVRRRVCGEYRIF